MLLTRSGSRMCDQQFLLLSEPIVRAPWEGYAHRVLHIAFGWLLSPLVTRSTSGLIKTGLIKNPSKVSRNGTYSVPLCGISD